MIMGCNYYVKLNECKCCERCDKIHIGKSSYGWAFNFRGHNTNQFGYAETDDMNSVELPNNTILDSWMQWKKFLNGKNIVDEYGESITFNDFCEMIETIKSPTYVNELNGNRNKDHIKEILSDNRYNNFWFEYQDKSRHWHDNLGYSFSNIYFS